MSDSCISYTHAEFESMVHNYFTLYPPVYFFQGQHNFIADRWKQVTEQLFQEYDALWKRLAKGAIP